MYQPSILILFLTFSLLNQVSEGRCKKNVTTEESLILDYINNYRKLHWNTPDMCYGETDVTHHFSAEAWSKILSTRPHREMGFSGNQNVGEIISWRYRTEEPVMENFWTAIDGWYGQIGHYNFTSLTSKDGRRVGSFTQTVWAGSEEVNCGMGHIKDGRNMFIVCQFYPRGNIHQNTKQNVFPLKEKSGEELAGSVYRILDNDAGLVDNVDYYVDSYSEPNHDNTIETWGAKSFNRYYASSDFDRSNEKSPGEGESNDRKSQNDDFASDFGDNSDTVTSDSSTRDKAIVTVVLLIQLGMIIFGIIWHLWMFMTGRSLFNSTPSDGGEDPLINTEEQEDFEVVEAVSRQSITTTKL